MTRRPEQILHRQAARLLETVLGSDSWFAHIPMGAYRTPAEGGILKALGAKAGTPDLLIIHAGRAYWIELKAPPKTLASGRPSQEKASLSQTQIETIAEIEAAGSPVAVCRSLVEIQAALTKWGVPMRGKVAA